MKRLMSISFLLLATTGLMAVILVVSFAVSAHHAFERRQSAQQVVATVGISRDLFTALQNVRVERGTVNTALATATPADAEALHDIEAVRGKSGKALDSALARLNGDTDDGAAHGVWEINQARDRFIQVRREVDAALPLPRDQRPPGLGAAWVAADNALVDAVEDLSERLSNRINRTDPFIAEMMKIKQLAWAARAAAGTDRLLIGAAIAKGDGLTVADQLQLASLAGDVEAPWSLIEADARLPTTPQSIQEAVGRGNDIYFTQLAHLRHEILDALVAGRPAPISGQDWIKASNPGLKSLLGVADEAFILTQAYAAKQAATAQRDVVISSFLMLLVLGLSAATSLFIIGRVVRPLARMTETMRQVADGDLDQPIPYQSRGDEIGALALALSVFRQTARERRRVEGELLRSQVAKQAAEAANLIKSQFLANMSHEIRTPLNGVLGMVQVMELDDLSAAQRDRLETIRDSGGALLQILNDVLDLSKIEAGKFTFKTAEFDVEDLSNRVTAVFSEAAAAKDIALDCCVSPAARGVWMGDAARIRQILSNLVSNAVKFTWSGAVSLQIDRTDVGLEFNVRDSGEGIAADQLPRLFNKFSQLDESDTRRFGGTGLGLAISRELAELMDGRIDVESTPGEGSVFKVTLPLPFVRPHVVRADRDVAAPAAAVQAADGRAVRILAAEDNATNRKVLGALLEPLGVELTIVVNGLEAVETWRTVPCDLVLMDIQMPEMGGVAASSRIRELEREQGLEPIPIIALSANAMRHQVEEYLAAGMTAHIAKPIRLSELYAALSAALAPSGDRPVQAAAARL